MWHMVTKGFNIELKAITVFIECYRFDTLIRAQAVDKQSIHKISTMLKNKQPVTQARLR